MWKKIRNRGDREKECERERVCVCVCVLESIPLEELRPFVVGEIKLSVSWQLALNEIRRTLLERFLFRYFCSVFLFFFLSQKYLLHNNNKHSLHFYFDKNKATFLDDCVRNIVDGSEERIELVPSSLN